MLYLFRLKLNGNQIMSKNKVRQLAMKLKAIGVKNSVPKLIDLDLLGQPECAKTKIGISSFFCQIKKVLHFVLRTKYK